MIVPEFRSVPATIRTEARFICRVAPLQSGRPIDAEEFGLLKNDLRCLLLLIRRVAVLAEDAP